jgi:hypothetical protein
MEFLMGRSMNNALYNLEVKDQFTEAMHEMGYDLEVRPRGLLLVCFTVWWFGLDLA